MRILIVTPYLPRAEARHGGGRLAHDRVRRLADRHAVTVVARCLPGDEAHVAALSADLERVRISGRAEVLREGSVSSLVRAAGSLRTLVREAREEVRRSRFDVVHVEHSEMGAMWNPADGPPAALLCVDVISKPARRRFEAARGLARVVAWLSWRAQATVEARALRCFAGVFTLSRVDADWVRRLAPHVSPVVLRPGGGLGFVGRPRHEIDRRVGYLATLNRSANQESLRWFLGEVWPAVRTTGDLTEFAVAGVGAPEAFRRELEEVPGVRFLGEVPDVEEFYSGCLAFAAPVLIGGGIIVKVLDALASGTPVVTTSRGNEGIGAKNGRDLIVADSAADFAEGLRTLLADPAVRLGFAQAGRRFVRREFPPDGEVESIEREYRRILVAGASTPGDSGSFV